MILLQRNSNLKCRGVNFPKNFILRIDFPEKDDNKKDDHVYVDCFADCRIYDEETLKKHPIFMNTKFDDKRRIICFFVVFVFLFLPINQEN